MKTHDNHPMDPSKSDGIILIVDDEQFLREYTRYVLEQSGFHVVTAADGEEAWSFYRSNQERIALIITDVVMPGSFDGFELADRVHRTCPTLKVLFMTGALGDDHPRFAELSANNRILLKPFFPDQLIQIVKQSCFDTGSIPRRITR
ncbi:MAG: response regulator [Verrucomicrobia bacterium]|nr:response regulator [Verrucomicrobiota bacterium]